jgi:quercetin dioxygenase-like cupin family protein
MRIAGWTAGAVLAAAFAGGFALAQGAAQSGRTPQFENTEVKVWKSVVLPHHPLPFHRHEHPRVIIALVGGTMDIVQKDGARERHVWQSGHAYWLPSSPPGTMHQDVNAGDKPMVVMVVELETAS